VTVAYREEIDAKAEGELASPATFDRMPLEKAAGS
jgi:hypothetical protein